MSITIDGTKDKEKIFKEGGSKVKVIPSLYLNDTEITASGGGGTDPGDEEQVGTIIKCDTYSASSYATYDKIIVSIDNWEIVDVPDKYYEINDDGEYYVSQFAGYAGIVVTQKKTSDTLLIQQNGWYEKSEYEGYNKIDVQVTNYSYRGSHSGVDYYRYTKNNSYFMVSLVSEEGILIAVPKNPVTSTLDETFSNVIDQSNDVGSFEIQADTGYNIEDYNITWNINGSVAGILRPNDSTDIADIATVEAASFTLSNTSLETTITLFNDKGYTAELGIWANPSFASSKSYKISFNLYDIEDYSFSGDLTVEGTCTLTPRTASSSTLSLRSTVVNSTPAESTTTVENLVVNNDALIQGNLEVAGCINDLSWYWENASINTTSTNIGMGFLAKVTDLTFQVNSATITVPTLQLSPGSQYLTSNYSVAWTPQGSLIIDATNIANITGTIQILRYE